MIRFLDLKKINSEYKKEFSKKLNSVISSGEIILGEEVYKFEKEFSDFTSSKYCVSVSNGLDALRLILTAHNISNGDEVIVPAHTFIATWLAVSQTGAKIIPVDVDLKTMNIDTNKLESKLSPKTKAIICVHLYGYPSEINKLREISRKHKIFLFEDAAQAHGTSYYGKKAGSLGDAAAFSFYPGKNLGALGDAGAITCRNKVIFKKLKKLRNYGSTKKYYHDDIGFNCRMDNLQAAFLRLKLNQYKFEHNKRYEISRRYLNEIDNKSVELPVFPSEEGSSHGLHLFVIRSKKRNELQKHLLKNNIETIIHYPICPHLQTAYKHLGYKKGSFPISEQIASEALSIPMHSFLKRTEVSNIISSINSWKH